MADALARQSDAVRKGERLAALLTATAGELAAHTAPQPVTAVAPERVDAVALLAKLGQRLPEFCKRAVLGEVDNDDWDDMAGLLAEALQACLAQIEQVVIDVDAAADSDETAGGTLVRRDLSASGP
ncbi:MAG TPA: hypothetical protein VGX25_23060 [Actinophytocola sp.]|uniref:hypothetical protein n=1 Tax=Actinophytocola sp. TaxID=1872138 RepID=UPI002DDD3D0F|nr:hypothetical protein [Actinophytocola sp.]HEV2782281.1 hypothetical protein [Actinophytocola sp.]